MYIILYGLNGVEKAPLQFVGLLRHQPTPLAASRRRVDAARSLTILDNTFVAPMRPISFFAQASRLHYVYRPVG